MKQAHWQKILEPIINLEPSVKQTKKIDAYDMLRKIRNTQRKGFQKIKSYFDNYDTGRLLLAGRTIRFGSPDKEKCYE